MRQGILGKKKQGKIKKVFDKIEELGYTNDRK